MKLSKSRYCEGITCIKKLWLSINKPEEKEELKIQQSKHWENIWGLSKRINALKQEEISAEYDSRVAFGFFKKSFADMKLKDIQNTMDDLQNRQNEECRIRDEIQKKIDELDRKISSFE